MPRYETLVAAWQAAKWHRQGGDTARIVAGLNMAIVAMAQRMERFRKAWN